MLARRMAVTIWSISFLLSIGNNVLGQQADPRSPRRDRQAIQVVRRALSAGGGVSALSSIQDYSASGTITTNLAGEQVQTNVSVKGRGTREFRLDASLPNGIRSVIANNGKGISVEPDGAVTRLPHPVALNLTGAALPIAQFLAALTDASVSISYIGPSSYNDRAVQVVHVSRVPFSDRGSTPLDRVPDGMDFVVDSATNMIVATRDQAFPKDGFGRGIPHELVFSDYRVVGGIMVPFLIKDIVGGNLVTTIQLEQMTFNTGLGDNTFQQ